MSRRDRPVEPARAAELLAEGSLEVAQVVEPGLGLDPRRLDERRSLNGYASASGWAVRATSPG